MKTKLEKLIDSIEERKEYIFKGNSWHDNDFVTIDDVLDERFEFMHSEIQAFIKSNIIPLFIRFLKSNDAYSIYIENNEIGSNTGSWPKFPNMTVKDYICNAFSWDDSGFWPNLDDEWCHLLEETFGCEVQYNNCDD